MSFVIRRADRLCVRRCGTAGAAPASCVHGSTDIAHDVVPEVADGHHGEVAEEVLEQEDHHHGDADGEQGTHLTVALDQLRQSPVEGTLETFACPQGIRAHMHRFHLSQQQPQEGDEKQ
jgi:hypothetical protein